MEHSAEAIAFTAIIGGLLLLMEAAIFIYKRPTKKSKSQSFDGKSTLILWSGIVTSVIVSYFCMHYCTGHDVVHCQFVDRVVVVIIFAIGVIIRLTAVFSLGQYFTTNVAVCNEHKLVTTGLYRFMRHPSYTGLLLAFFAYSMTFENHYATIFIPFTVGFLLMYRITIEERVLVKLFGPEYELYKSNTAAIIPFIF